MLSRLVAAVQNIEKPVELKAARVLFDDLLSIRIGIDEIGDRAARELKMFTRRRAGRLMVELGESIEWLIYGDGQSVFPLRSLTFAIDRSWPRPPWPRKNRPTTAEIDLALESLPRDEFGKPVGDLPDHIDDFLRAYDFTSQVCLSVDGSAEDVIRFQALSLLRAVGVERLKTCDCGVVFVKNGRREFCSERCQNRVYMRNARAAERGLPLLEPDLERAFWQRFQQRRAAHHGKTKRPRRG